MALEEVAGHAVITVLIHLGEKLRRIRFLKCRVFSRNADVRVSFAALLVIQDGGKYVLIRNLHRREVFAPLGGVVKYHSQAQADLDRLEFRPEDYGPGEIMKHDLRGLLARRSLPGIVKWFEGGEGRETARECLARELEEELNEIGSKIDIPSPLELRHVRTIHEGPESVAGQNYTLFRHLDIYALANSAKAELLAERILDLSKDRADLRLASAPEILHGRTDDGTAISHTAVYMLQRKRVRRDEAPFARVGAAGGGPGR